MQFKPLYLAALLASFPAAAQETATRAVLKLNPEQSCFVHAMESGFEVTLTPAKTGYAGKGLSHFIANDIPVMLDVTLAFEGNIAAATLTHTAPRMGMGEVWTTLKINIDTLKWDENKILTDNAASLPQTPERLGFIFARARSYFANGILDCYSHTI